MATYNDFRQTWLWRRAFVDQREDASEAEQEFFRTQFLQMRDKAAQLVTRISTDLPGMTVHDVTHLDALWDTASLVSEDSIDLNPTEAFVLGASILLHDAGMSLAAFPNGLSDVRETLVWKDTVARYLANLKVDGKAVPDPEALSTEFERQIVPDVLRRLHAEKAEQLADQSWEMGGIRYHLIDDPELRSFYGPTVGQIAHSHWWPVSKVETELNSDLGAFAPRTQHVVDKVKLACMLRVADAIHRQSQSAEVHQGDNPATRRFRTSLVVPGTLGSTAQGSRQGCLHSWTAF
ncbi:hypothetical protein J5289_19085 [Rhizobium sp. B230/85]|uniref:HD domain-containing protein n=1 Tax=unclassified Rhizobium TaxID=2613769 RepID=UPI001ADD395E|nr:MULTISPECIES: hypothetical protein [unclassified Rhizobium]MBO9136464.1 hypothetical protein [Rhizobium sp. B209b/85]QXZ98663.1 hypothetical protein J5289_19085 [Rhizobium sp. B230/85]